MDNPRFFQSADGLEEDTESAEWLSTACADDDFGDKELSSPASGLISPKRPAKCKEPNPVKKHLKLERRTEEKPADSDVIFAQYIASEIKGISDLQAKRVAKWKIHNAIFEAQTGLASPYPQFHPQYHTVHVDNAVPVSVNDNLPTTNISSVT